MIDEPATRKSVIAEACPMKLEISINDESQSKDGRKGQATEFWQVKAVRETVFTTSVLASLAEGALL